MDQNQDLSAHGDWLPLPPFTPHAVSHVARCLGTRIGAAGHTVTSLSEGLDPALARKAITSLAVALCLSAPALRVCAASVLALTSCPYGSSCVPLAKGALVATLVEAYRYTLEWYVHERLAQRI
jgi:hypothetical protein